MQSVCLALILALVCAPAIAAPAPKVAKQIERVENLYYKGRFEQALPLIHELRSSGDLDREQRIAVIRFQAFVLYLLALPKEARAAWQDLLELDPGHTLTDDEVSPEFLTFFGAVEPRAIGIEGRVPSGETLAAASAEGTNAADTAVQSKPDANLVEVEEAERGCGIVLCFIPFGGAQFANDQVIKGIIFAALEVAALAINIGMYWDRHGELTANDGRFGDQPAANAKLTTQRTAFVSFFALVALGIGDAFVLP